MDSCIPGEYLQSNNKSLIGEEYLKVIIERLIFLYSMVAKSIKLNSNLLFAKIFSGLISP